MYRKTLKRIAVSGLFTFILIVPCTGLKAGERSSTISSGSFERQEGKIDIFDPDFVRINPIENIVGADVGQNNDQVCDKCGETGKSEVKSEIDKQHNGRQD